MHIVKENPKSTARMNTNNCLPRCILCFTLAALAAPIGWDLIWTSLGSSYTGKAASGGPVSMWKPVCTFSP